MPLDSEHDTKISLAKVNRKIAKPIMEKKRRARINASLNELKTLLVEVLQKEGCRHSSKMEKADILEMAVRHLKNLQRQQAYAKSYQASSNGTLRESYSSSSSLPLEKYAQQPLSAECSATSPINHLISQSNNDSRFTQHISPHPTPDSTVSSPTALKLDVNRNLLPAPKPTMLNHQSIPSSTASAALQSVMTQAGNNEIALLLPQNIFKQTNPPGLLFPVYTSVPSGDNKQQSVMISINMPNSGSYTQASGSAFTKINSSTTSTTSNHLKQQVSPVWRPW